MAPVFSSPESQDLSAKQPGEGEDGWANFPFSPVLLSPFLFSEDTEDKSDMRSGRYSR